MAIEVALVALAPFRANSQYSEWMQFADNHARHQTAELFQEVFLILIHIARNEGKRQGSLLLRPLPQEERDDKNSSKDEVAACSVALRFEPLTGRFRGMGQIASKASIFL